MSVVLTCGHAMVLTRARTSPDTHNPARTDLSPDPHVGQPCRRFWLDISPSGSWLAWCPHDPACAVDTPNNESSSCVNLAWVCDYP